MPIREEAARVLARLMEGGDDGGGTAGTDAEVGPGRRESLFDSHARRVVSTIEALTAAAEATGDGGGGDENGRARECGHERERERERELGFSLLAATFPVFLERQPRSLPTLLAASRRALCSSSARSRNLGRAVLLRALAAVDGNERDGSISSSSSSSSSSASASASASAVPHEKRSIKQQPKLTKAEKRARKQEEKEKRRREKKEKARVKLEREEKERERGHQAFFRQAGEGGGGRRNAEGERATSADPASRARRWWATWLLLFDSLESFQKHLVDEIWGRSAALFRELEDG